MRLERRVAVPTETTENQVYDWVAFELSGVYQHRASPLSSRDLEAVERSIRVRVAEQKGGGA